MNATRQRNLFAARNDIGQALAASLTTLSNAIAHKHKLTASDTAAAIAAATLNVAACAYGEYYGRANMDPDALLTAFENVVLEFAGDRGTYTEQPE